MTDFPLEPGSTIGILGGGQLGRMLALAAARLGFDVAILDPEPDCPAARVARTAIAAPYDDDAALKALADVADVITFEFENVPAQAVERLRALGAETAPNARALAIAQDRVEEKRFLGDAGAPTVAFAEAADLAGLAKAVEIIGSPCLIKTRREGYDGKGQTWIEQPSDLAAAFVRVGSKPVIVEAPAAFERELSVIAARGRSGEIALYPLGENHHEGGILRRTHAPAEVSASTLAQAQQIAARILTSLDYVGVLAVELFELDGGKLLVNEIAPRVHNSGHWTLDGCEVDQFEQQIRAVAGWPLGPTHALARTEMINLIGDEAGDWKKLISEPNARLWLYGKREARPGRKMGHINRLRPRPLED
ncbi:MAG TPA: 5-(carboxyamino)imidazole ribonucleotide synthase [Caulobacteraceae bacterium]